MKIKILILFLMTIISIGFITSQGLIPPTSGDLTINNNNTYITQNFSGNLTNLSQLNDVNINTPSDNQLLVYNTLTKKWVNGFINTFLTFTNDYLFFNGDNEIKFNETRLNENGDSRYVNIEGDNMTGDLNIDGNLTADNFYYGSTYGIFNETAPNRPFTSNFPRTITVNSLGGGDYLTIQEAVNQVPYILRHEYIINVADGTYNEDVYIPPTITSGINNPATEGSVVILQINGESLDKTRVKSFQASGIVGVWGLTISNFNIYGQEYSSDENASISIYGSNSILLIGLNFTSTVDNAVMGYGSGIYIHSSYFENTQKNGLKIKRGGFGVFGDDYNNAWNSGNLSISVVTVSNGMIDINSKNNVSAPQLAKCYSGSSSGFVTYKGGQICNGIAIIQESTLNEKNVNPTYNEVPFILFNTSSFRKLFLGISNDKTIETSIKIFSDNSNVTLRYIDFVVNKISTMVIKKNEVNISGNLTAQNITAEGMFINGDNAKLIIYDNYPAQNSEFQIGRSSIERLKTTVRDNDLNMEYVQDFDGDGSHSWIFDIDGSLNITRAKYKWTFNDISNMILSNTGLWVSKNLSVDGNLFISDYSMLEDIFIGKFEDLTKPAREGLFIAYNNSGIRQGYFGIENDDRFEVGMRIVANNSGADNEKVAFFLENYKNMELNQSGLWVKNNITADYYFGDGSQLTNLPTGGSGIGNATFNESLTTSLYISQNSNLTQSSGNSYAGWINKTFVIVGRN